MGTVCPYSKKSGTYLNLGALETYRIWKDGLRTPDLRGCHHPVSVHCPVRDFQRDKQNCRQKKKTPVISELVTASIRISNLLLFANSIFVGALPFSPLDLRLSNARAVLSNCAVLQGKRWSNSLY